MQEYKNILVPVDGSATAEHSLKRAVEIAQRNNAHLDILNVIDLKQFTVNFGGVVDTSGDIVYQTFQDAEDYVDGLIKKVKKTGFKDIEPHIRYGSPRSVISKEFPADHNTDLIVMGPTGLNAVERVLIGAVTDYVIRLASCDVIIVH
ncbi:universal stress protein [Ligilactobacillus sp. LYQ60]|uniref:universal stress protein n=1 Tax=unclassified Ligilactobacillus TaxID=2767920 RepID=UPI003853AED1